MVLVRNGRPWFDLKAVCQSIGVKDIEHEAELLGDGHVTCVDTYDEDGSVNRIIKCSVEGLDVILERRQASGHEWIDKLLSVMNQDQLKAMARFAMARIV